MSSDQETKVARSGQRCGEKSHDYCSRGLSAFGWKSRRLFFPTIISPLEKSHIDQPQRRQPNMDITRSVVSERDRALLGGDYRAYHAQATRRIHAIRKRLGIATPRARKYTPKAPVTAENVSQSAESVLSFLYCSLY